MWTLNASGQAASEAEERKLVAELGKVLNKFHAATSGFTGDFHRGPVHDEPAPPEPEDVAQKTAKDAQE